MKKLTLLLSLLAAFPPLSTDMYLAAIPLLVKQWHQPLAVVNLTLVFFFVTYCLFLLIYGPLSDRYGRRVPLLWGLALFILASLMCSVAGGVVTMIIARILQGAGAAAASAIVFAICKDLFIGHLRQQIFVRIGVIVAAAPMIAPVIGGWIITVVSWRAIFVVQALLGLLAFIGVLRMNESLEVPVKQGWWMVLRGYQRLMGNRAYLCLTLAFACMGVPFFAFIASSPDIYIKGLGYSEQHYGLFFGINASAFMIAMLLFSRLTRHYVLQRLLPMSYLGVILCSLPLVIPDLPMPYRLAVPMWLVTFFFAFGRPPGNNLILEQVDRDAGAASSFMVFVFFITGAAAMWFISFNWQDKVMVLGLLGMTSASVTLLSWLVINHLLALKFPDREHGGTSA